MRRMRSSITAIAVAIAVTLVAARAVAAAQTATNRSDHVRGRGPPRDRAKSRCGPGRAGHPAGRDAAAAGPRRVPSDADRHGDDDGPRLGARVRRQRHAAANTGFLRMRRSSYPVLAAARWAQRAQAEDQIRVARLGHRRNPPPGGPRDGAGVPRGDRGAAAGGGQSTRPATTPRRTSSMRARFSRKAPAAGSTNCAPSQELAVDEVLLEAALLALRRAQEALGVLVAADAPVDAAAEPAFEIAALPTDSELAGRTHGHQAVRGAHRRRAARLSATAGAIGCRRRRSASSLSW